MEWLTVTQLGNAVGTTSSSARKHIKKFSDFFKTKKTDGVIRYAENSLSILKRIEELKTEGKSPDEIQYALEWEYDKVKPAYEDKNGNGSYIAKDVEVETLPRERMITQEEDEGQTSDNASYGEEREEISRDSEIAEPDDLYKPEQSPGVFDTEESDVPESEETTSPQKDVKYKETAERILTRDIVPMLKEVLSDLAPDARDFVRSSVTIALSEAVRTVADQTSEIISLRNDLAVLKDEMHHFIVGSRLNLSDIGSISEFNTNDRIIRFAEPGPPPPVDPDPATVDLFPEFDVELQMRNRVNPEPLNETIRKIRDGIIEYGQYMERAAVQAASQKRSSEKSEKAVKDETKEGAEDDFYSLDELEEDIAAVQAVMNDENGNDGSSDAPPDGGGDTAVMDELKPAFTRYGRKLAYFETANYMAALTDRIKDLRENKKMSFSQIAAKLSADRLKTFTGNDEWTAKEVKNTYLAELENQDV